MNELEHELLLELAADVKKLRLEVLDLTRQIERQKSRKQWYSMKEFCEVMKISRYTVMDRIKMGFYPWAVKDGKSWRFPSIQVERITANLA